MRDTEDLDGLFSGWDPAAQRYDTTTWGYAAGPDRATGYQQDPTLQHPRCVYQVLRRHFARYTPELVEQACGVPPDLFRELADAFCSASGPEKTASICYALGWTQHSKGSQLIRTAAILQLLLGNIGRPGGGVLALRGHASIQGSTDIPTLFDLLPGYLTMPLFKEDPDDLAAYVEKRGSRSGQWAYLDRYLVSLLKAYYGEAAQRDNDFGLRWLPRLTGDHSHMAYWLEMADGKVEGLFAMGDNPAVAGPNAGFERRALAKLKWMVVRDMVETETASFWYDSPEVKRGDLVTADIETEVFLMPAAGHAEKAGTFTNTQRLLQFREKAVDPPGDSRSEPWFVYHLGRRLKERARGDTRPRNAGLRALTWDYATSGPTADPDVEDVLREINGYFVADRTQVPGFGALKSDGTTACGCWIYSGVFPGPGQNRAAARDARGPYGQGGGFAGPADRRILYNRASARPDGRPWSEKKKLVWWDESKREWTGLDTPDFTRTKPPDYAPPPGATGDDALAGDKPFLLHGDGLGWIWVPVGLRDGPLPTHYEPWESPIRNPLYPGQQNNPAAMKRERPGNVYAALHDTRFPYVLTTYRLTEHHTTGAMSRVLSHLAELQPEPFCEISPELAAERHIEHGGWVTITTARGAIRARAMVTRRLRPLLVENRTVHQVGLPWHWGYRGLVTGDVANDLTAISEDPNSRIMESKALLCNIAPAEQDEATVRTAETRRGHGIAD
jgi:formate dehydrogenase major subunit